MTKRNQKVKTLKFSNDCTMVSISENYQEMMEAIRDSKNLKLDLTNVEQVDASFIQLLITAQIEAKRTETNLEVDGDSRIVNEFATHVFCHVSLSNDDNVVTNGE